MATLQKKKKHSEIKYHVIMMLVCILCILPLVLVLSISFTDMDYIYKNGYSFWPSEFNAGAYEYIAKNPKELLDAYRTTIEVTVRKSALGRISAFRPSHAPRAIGAVSPSEARASSDVKLAAQPPSSGRVKSVLPSSSAPALTASRLTSRFVVIGVSAGASFEAAWRARMAGME